MLYFAYGSNLSHAQMLARCPGAEFVGPALLHNYAFQFDGYSKNWRGAVASIVPAADSVVQGGLYKLGHEELKALDQHEGLGERYRRHVVTVITEAGEAVEALAYVRPSPQVVGKPTTEYINTIKQGIIDCGLEPGEMF